MKIYTEPYLNASKVDMDKLSEFKNNRDLFLKNISSYIVNWLITDIINNYKVESGIQFSESTNQKDNLIQIRLKKIILNSKDVKRMDSRGSFIIRKLFEAYAYSPLQMPDNTLNAVFREYLRQYIFINNATSLRPILASKKGLFIFSDSSLCRAGFDDSYQLQKNNSKTALPIIYINPDIVNNTIEVSTEKETNSIIIDRKHFRLCLMRVIADYISGMTDNYAEQEYRKLYGIIHDILS